MMQPMCRSIASNNSEKRLFWQDIRQQLTVANKRPRPLSPASRIPSIHLSLNSIGPVIGHLQQNSTKGLATWFHFGVRIPRNVQCHQFSDENKQRSLPSLMGNRHPRQRNRELRGSNGKCESYHQVNFCVCICLLRHHACVFLTIVDRC